MSKRLATAIDELRAEETRIQADLDELRQRVKSGEIQIKRIQKALSVLDEKPRSKSGNQKPAATRQEVIRAMTELLRTNGTLEEDVLKRLVAEKVASLGKSRIGLALRFTEALNDKRFARADDGSISENAKAASA
jgi:predicted nuclease with TOPRIM domain